MNLYVSQHVVEMGRDGVGAGPPRRCQPAARTRMARIYILNPNKGYCDASLSLSQATR